MTGMARVLVVGSAEQSGGGVSTVIKLMKRMKVWDKYHCTWLGTQIQRNYLWKLWYAVRSNFIALFTVWRYDIVHLHTVPDLNCMIIQLPVYLLALVLRKKIIMHVHVGNQLLDHCDDIFFIWLLKNSDCILLLAHRWKKIFDESFVRRYKDICFPPVEVIYNPCLTVSRVAFAEKKKIIAMAAYFCDNKAPDLLIRAWQSIHEDYLEWHVVMMGNGEVDRYRQLTKDMGVDESVLFAGYVVGKERERMLREASIYCMCSYKEGFPMVVLESWMYGINVVTTPVGGLPDVIEDEKNCLVFDFGDWQGLARQLRVLIEDEAKRQEMSEYSRTFVESVFSIEKIDGQYDRLYNTLLNEN